MYARQQDGFGQERPAPATESPTFHSETMAVYPGDKNNLPYDVVVERLHIEEPEPPAPVTEPEKTFEEKLFLDALLETYLPGQEISTTTFREQDKADTGHRDMLLQLGFAEKELLTEFGYPTQRFVLPPKKQEDIQHG